MKAFIKIDHAIDLITNSSSELFVMDAKISKQLVVELINAALKGHSSVSEGSIEERIFKDGDMYEAEWKIEQALEAFPEETRAEVREKYFKDPKYWGVSFDRDWVYEMDNRGVNVRGLLMEIGFELIDTDY